MQTKTERSQARIKKIEVEIAMKEKEGEVRRLRNELWEMEWKQEMESLKENKKVFQSIFNKAKE